MFSFFKNNTKNKTAYELVNKIPKEELEELLLESDVSYELVEEILEKFGNNIKIKDLQTYLLGIFKVTKEIKKENTSPFVDIIIGVNGAGKTTTIAKLAHKYKNKNKNVLLGGADTFRAAAVEQLSLWADKIEVGIVKGQKNSDPSAVAYSTLSKAIAKNIDNVIIDTAGRLQNQTNLLNELKKIIRVCKKVREDFPHRKILIIDGMCGNMAIAQAKIFSENIGIDGIIITKLDGTSKGGAILSIVKELNIPILYIGTGESYEDLQDFDSKNYIQSIINYICESTLANGKS